MQKILLVEDDTAIINPLKNYLSEEGFVCKYAETVAKAIDLLDKERFDLLLIDIKLPDGNGYFVYSHAGRLGIPAIFLTASSDENSVVMGLEMGADDYISKPFRPRELISRIKNVLRRHEGAGASIPIGNGITVDTEKGIALKTDPASEDTEEIPLTALEFRILLNFVNNRGRLLPREKILDDIWDIAGDFVNDNTLTVYIKRLREKIEADPQNPAIIKTVRGLGYRMELHEDPQ